MQDKFANRFSSILVSFIIFWKFWNCISELSFLIFICIYVIIRELRKVLWEENHIKVFEHLKLLPRKIKIWLYRNIEVIYAKEK